MTRSSAFSSSGRKAYILHPSDAVSAAAHHRELLPAVRAGPQHPSQGAKSGDADGVTLGVPASLAVQAIRPSRDQL
jgi:hypothetical protein